jgi:tetratricopeptide (TPR) repeat protein
MSVPPASTSVKGSLNPDAGWADFETGSRPSMIPKAPPPPRFGPNTSMAPQTGRMSLPPGAGAEGPQRHPGRHTNMKSYPPEAPEGDRYYRHALLLREQGRNAETLAKLEELYRVDPNHKDGRILMQRLACEQGRPELAAQHTEWVLGVHSKRSAYADVCSTYRRTRMAFAELRWTEQSLQQVLMAAERVSESRVVLDATKLLLHQFPQSPVLAQAFYASARVQQAEGRPDLAKTTLQNLINRFPRDPYAEEARRRLLELGP